MRYLGIKNDGNYAALIWESVAFNAVVPMDGNYSVESHNVTGPINFVIGGFIPGGKAVYRLIADGVNSPTFTGFKESSDSAGYYNLNTIANTIEFTFDGIDYWYRVKQEKGALTARVFTFNTPGAISLNIPPNCTTISIAGFGGGGGGASGRKSAVGVAAFGGGGGAGSSWIERTYPLDEFGLQAGALLTGTVGAGGAGGAPVTANSTNGNAGVAGSNTLLRIGNAGAIIFNTVTGGGAAPSPTTTNGTGGTNPGGDIAGVGGGLSSIAGNAGGGLNSWKIGGGGGGGGGVDAANTPRGGGVRGIGNQGAGGGIGTNTNAAASTTANGANGANGGESLDGKITPGNGGGGGGASSAVGFNGGNGGAGGPGAGGGGGGAARDGAGSSGAGGAGGSGALQIIFS